MLAPQRLRGLSPTRQALQGRVHAWTPLRLHTSHIKNTLVQCSSSAEASISPGDIPSTVVGTTSTAGAALASAINPAGAAKLALLEVVAGLDRGALASPADKQRVEELVRVLESQGGTPQPIAGQPAPIEGVWELLYINTEVFRASPFFLAFSSGLVQNQALAEAIFRFTDGIPGADVGPAYQTVDLSAGTLVSEVVLTVFPGLKGTVVTSSRVYADGLNQMSLAIESTRVSNSTFSPVLDSITVPVEQIIEALRGAGATRATYSITFCDDTMRVTRADGGQLMVHRRVTGSS